MIELSELGLPSKFSKWRDTQYAVIERAIEKSRLLVEAPPGTGKTLVAAGVQKILDMSATYITPNKSLQYQVCNEMPHAKMVMGRENYECILYKGLTAECCTDSEADPCDYSEECTYKVARAQAEASPLAVLNSSYYLYSSYYAHKFRRPLLIVDEVDLFEQAILGFVKVDISERVKKRLYGVGCPAVTSSMTIKQLKDWARTASSCVHRVVGLTEDPTEKESWKRLEGKLDYMVENIDDTWFSQYDQDSGLLALRPTRIAKYAPDLVWKSHERVLGMSGSILSSYIVAGDLGLDNTSFVSVPSTFPLENRPIYDLSKYVGNINNSNTASLIPTISMLLNKIVAEYPNDKCLVHTHSYLLANALKTAMDNDRVIINSDAKGRQSALNEYLYSDKPLILVSPSFARGLDLAGEEYKCVVVVKAPFANLGDEAVKRRLAMTDGQLWYNRDAAATFLQMCGRGVRSATKACDTYFLDANICRLAKMCPDWFQKAIQKV